MNAIGILQGRLTPSNGRGIQFFPQEEWQKEFAVARDIGFDCIELLVKADEYAKNPLFSDAGIDKIKSLKKKYQLETPSVHGFYARTESYSLVLKELLERAASVGAHTVLVSFFGPNALFSESDKNEARMRLREPLEVAARLGISIAVEVEMPAPELKGFIESFKSPAIGAYYDLGNMASTGANLRKEIKLLGGLIKGVHVKDRMAYGGETVELGSGATDFAGAFDVFVEIGYNRPYIIQGARSSQSDDRILNKKYLDFVKEKLQP